jgi:hypothetical protein
MYLRIKGVQSGPFDIDEVAREHAAGRVDDAVMSWCEGEACWTSLTAVSPRPALPSHYADSARRVECAGILRFIGYTCFHSPRKWDGCWCANGDAVS